MILQGWMCVGNNNRGDDGCGTIRAWGVFDRQGPDKDRRIAVLNCAVCRKPTTHAFQPGHQVGIEWREFQPES